MTCPDCGAEMQIGVSHDPAWRWQYECPACRLIIGVP